MRASLRRLLLLVLLPVLAGCGTMSYYGQAVHGQCQILHRKKPIQDLLADPKIPPALKQRLELVLTIRQFAEKELHLPANGHYRHYADLGRRFAVWSVYAAPEFSLEAKGWWYPVVGRLEYQGYFKETNAQRFAAKLERKGFDVHVGGVEAYSTLGWFRDPVLNTFVFNEDTDLADLLFHELAHQRLFVGGDTDFNEAFATAVADEGVERWLRANGDQAKVARHRKAIERRQQFLALVAGARAKLEKLYASIESAQVCVCAGAKTGAGSWVGGTGDSPVPSGYPPDGTGKGAAASRTSSRRAGLSPVPLGESPSGAGGSPAPPALRKSCPCAERRREKAGIFEQLRRDYAESKALWGGSGEYDGWFTQPLNNALLNTVDTYYAWVPAFRRMLEMCGGDLGKFYKEAEALGKLKKAERERRLRELAR